MKRRAVNVCEHGDHEAPEGQRFCSQACLRCEHESESENGCDGICGASGAARQGAKAVNEDDLDLQTIWAVLVQDSRSGKWMIDSLALDEETAMAMTSRETMRVVELELAPVGSRESMFSALAALQSGTSREDG